MARKKKNRPARSNRAGWLDTLTDPATIRAAGEPSAPDHIRLYAEGEPVDLKADADGDMDAAGKPKLRKFSGTAYTGGAMSVGFGMPIVVDLEGMQVPRQNNPMLKGHDTDQIVGHSEKVEVTAQRIKVSGIVSNTGDAAAEVKARADEGFPWQMSIGASIQQREYVDAGKQVQVNGKNFTGPIMVARKTVLGEVSFVPIGADQATSASIAAHQERVMGEFEKWLQARGFDPAKLSDGEKTLLKAAFEAEKKIAATTQTVTEPPIDFAAEMKKQLEAGQRLAREAAAAELTRQSEIRLRCEKRGVTEAEIEITAADGTVTRQRVNLAAHAIREGWTPDQAELVALRQRPTVTGGAVYSTTHPEVNDVVLECAMLQAARHQYHLEDDSFYSDTIQGQNVRRVSERLQRETQGALKARYTDQVQQAAHTMFKGRITPKQFLQAGLARAGVSRGFDFGSETGLLSVMKAWRHHEDRIEAEGASNLSIQNILANVMNKFALQGYLFVEQAWREIAAIRSVPDFKPTKSINLLGSAMFRQFGSTGELANLNINDQAFANQANAYGIIGTIPWTHLVNDDLGMLTTIPLKIGQGAGLALNDFFWSLWASLATGSVAAAGAAGNINGAIPSSFTLTADDGNAFWRTTSDLTTASARVGKAFNKNKLTGGGSAISSTALSSAKAVFDNQVDPNGNPLGFDGATPILLHGPTTWRAVQELTRFGQLVGTGQTATPLQPNGNVWANQYPLRPVMSRYVESANYVNSATAWWILFNPAAVAVIEVAFLNGVDTPAVMQAGPDYQFDRPGISVRGTMPFGANQQNFRGGVYNVGA